MEPGEILKLLTEQLKEKKGLSVKAVKPLEPTPEPIAAEADKSRNRNPPQDFFLADFADCAFKDDQATMEASVFSLAKKKDHKLWTWTSADGKKTVEVAPGFYGRATQHDKDILIYCTSQLVAAINAGQMPNRTVRFSVYNFLLATKKGTSGDEYKRFIAALDRLKGTQIKTNIEAGAYRVAKGFGLIDTWGIIERTQNGTRAVAIEVTLSEWLFHAINAKEVLTINPRYFDLGRPLEKRLYEIARKHVGMQGSWRIGIEALRDKCGSTVSRIRQFRDELKEIETLDTLLEYKLAIEKDSAHYRASYSARFYLRYLPVALDGAAPRIELSPTRGLPRPG
jgi:plasmid replication initiation protein